MKLEKFLGKPLSSINFPILGVYPVVDDQDIIIDWWYADAGESHTAYHQIPTCECVYSEKKDALVY